MADNDAPLCPLVKEGGSGTICPAGLAIPIGTALTRRTLRSVAILVILGLLMTGLNLWWTSRVVQAANDARCGTVVADATIPLPPAGSDAREWAVQFEAIARARAAQLRCGG